MADNETERCLALTMTQIGVAQHIAAPKEEKPAAPAMAPPPAPRRSTILG